MVKIALKIEKTIEQNAEIYFEKAKKARKKIEGVKEIIEKTNKKIIKLKKKKLSEVKPEAKIKKVEKKKKEWFEKFRWFVSSEGFMIIGGRDATTNEIVIKKHTGNNDIVFHTDMAGSPFFVIHTEGKKVGKTTLQEVSNATFTFSRAFKLGLMTAKVFWVNPDQVSKQAQAGEYLQKGAFMIRGKTNYVAPNLDLAIGLTKEKLKVGSLLVGGLLMAGPVQAVKKHCEKYIELDRGDNKVSDIAKKIKSKLGGDLDTIIRILPTGSLRIKKLSR